MSILRQNMRYYIYKIYVLEVKMNFFKDVGKIAGNLNSVLGNTLAAGSNKQKQKELTHEQYQMEIKIRDKKIKQLEAQIRKLNQDNQFINKAFEDMQTQSVQTKQSYKTFEKMIKQNLEQFSAITHKLETDMKIKLEDTILNQLEELIGEKIEGMEVGLLNNEKPLDLNVKLDCSEFIKLEYKSIIESLKQQINSVSSKKAVEQLMKLQEQSKATQLKLRQQLIKSEKQCKLKITEISSTMISNEQEFEERLKSAKQESQTVVAELKSMLNKQKQHVAKVEKELSASKIAHEKYQKQIYTKCEENNQLVSKNKEMGSQIERLKLQAEQAVNKNKLNIEQLKTQLKKAEQQSEHQKQQLAAQQQQVEKASEINNEKEQKEQVIRKEEGKKVELIRNNIIGVGTNLKGIKLQLDQLKMQFQQKFKPVEQVDWITEQICIKMGQQLQKCQQNMCKQVIGSIQQTYRKSLQEVPETNIKVVQQKLNDYENRLLNIMSAITQMVQTKKELTLKAADSDEKLQKLEDKIKELQNQIMCLSASKVELQGKLSKSQNIIEQINNKVIAIQSEKADLEQRLKDKQIEYMKIEGDLNESSKQLAIQKQQNLNSTSKIETLSQKISELDDLKEELLGKLEQKSNQAQKEQKEVNQQILNDKIKQIEEKNMMIADNQQKITRLTQQNQELAQKISKFSEQSNKSDKIDTKETEEQSTNRVTELQKQINQLKTKIENDKQSYEGRIVQYERKMEDVWKQINNKHESVETQRSKQEEDTFKVEKAVDQQVQRQLQERQRQLQNIRKQIQQYEAKQNERIIEMQRLKFENSKIDRMQQEMTQKQNQIDAYFSQIQTLKQQVQKLQAQVKTQIQQIGLRIQIEKDLGEKIKKLQQQHTQLIKLRQDETKQIEIEQNQMINQLRQTQDNLNQIRTQCTAKDSQCQELIKQADTFKKFHQDLQNRFSQLAKSNEETKIMLEERIRQFQDLLTAQQQKCSTLQVEFNSKAEELCTVQEKLQESLYANGKTETERKQLNEKLRLIEIEKKQLNEAIKTLEAEKQEMKGDLELMKEMSSSMDDQFLQLTKSQNLNKQYQDIKKDFLSIFEKELNKTSLKQVQDKINGAENIIEKLTKTQQRLTAEVIYTTQQKQKLQVKLEKEASEYENLRNQLSNSKLKIQQLQKLLSSNQSKQSMLQEMRQKLEKVEKLKIDAESVASQLRKQLSKQKSTLQESRKIIQQKANQINQKQKQITLLKTKKVEAEESFKKEVQSLKNKCNKLEAQNSEVMSQTKQFKEKAQKYEVTINDLKKAQVQWKKQKEGLNQRELGQQEQILKMRGEVERVVVETAEKMKKQKLALHKEMLDRDEIFKNDKIALQKRYLQEIEKYKGELKMKDRKIQQAENEVKLAKAKLTDEKKNAAMLNGKMEQMKNDFSKIDVMEAQMLELKKQLLMKDEDLKRSFNKSKNLQSTIEQLETGIQSCQAYALQKSEQIQEITTRFNELEAELKKITKENEKLRQKCNFQTQLDEVNDNQNWKVPEVKKGLDRKDIILPIKRLVLKYFDASATYQQKVNTLNTLSQVLEFDKKESEILKGYRKIKLSNLESEQKDKKQPGIQNKFFDFLTSDK